MRPVAAQVEAHGRVRIAADVLAAFVDGVRIAHHLGTRTPTSIDPKNPNINRRDKVFPISWTRSFGKGRVFYTVLGDWEPTWKDPRYRTHLSEGIRWTLHRGDD